MIKKFRAQLELPAGFKPLERGKLQAGDYCLCTHPDKYLKKLQWELVDKYWFGRRVTTLNTLFIRPCAEESY